jgi:hypothetical protein
MHDVAADFINRSLSMSLTALGLLLTLQTAREPVTIKMVINTNTVAVATQDDPMLWVTLLGVGTPESIDSRKPDFLLGKLDPRWLASWLAPGTRALMERRGESVSGRPLVFLYRLEDGYCWNAHLVKVGAGFAAHQTEFPEFGKLVSMEEVAQREGAGIWKGYSPAPPEKPALEPVEVLAAVDQSVRVQSFDPSNFPRPKKVRYKDQSLVSAYVNMMLWSSPMMNGPWNGYTQHVNGYFRQNGTWVNPYWRRPAGTAGNY